MVRMYNNRSNNSGCYMLLMILTHLLASAAAIWTVVEFVIYLFKDNPFNWWSLGLTVFFIIVEIFFFIKFAMSD